MIAILISALLLSATPADQAKISAKPDVKNASKTRWADGTDTLQDGLTIVSSYFMLEWPQVRKEIGLSDKSYEEVRKAVDRATEAYSNEINRRIAEEKFDLFKNPLVVIGDLHEVQIRAMRTVMSRDQVRRITEIYLQIKGVFVFATNLEFQKAFNLSETQRENIKTADKQYISEKSKLDRQVSHLGHTLEDSKNRRPTPEEERAFRIEKSDVFEKNFEQRMVLHAIAAREITRQLTKRQREDFKKAQGKPFDIEEMIKPGSRYRVKQKEEAEKSKKEQ